MKNKLSILFLVIFVAGLVISDVSAQAEPYKYKGKEYYKVTSTDPAKDTGEEVCNSVGMTCVGYTAFSVDVCKHFNPSAATKSDANGSKAGFYCDGPPQGGACANEKNTCHVCPNCNVNADCSTQIGSLYREMYVECSGAKVVKPGFVAKMNGLASNWWGKFRSTVARSFDLYREKLKVLQQMVTVKQKVKISVNSPTGTVETEIPEDSYVCEFYQNNKKLVTCGALAAADHFCVEAMNSQYAKAEYCEDDGIIICSNPCTTKPAQAMPKQCAFDNDRPRGKQAAPLNFCNKTIKVQVNMTPGAKKAGQECAHGGECATGICLGQPSDNGIKYFCSCSQNRHDTSCNK